MKTLLEYLGSAFSCEILLKVSIPGFIISRQGSATYFYVEGKPYIYDLFPNLLR